MEGCILPLMSCGPVFRLEMLDIPSTPSWLTFHLPWLMSRCWLSLQGCGGDAVANRLRKTLVRIVNQSLTQYKAGIIASRPAHAPGSQQGTLCCSASLQSLIHSFIHSYIHSFNQSVCVFLESQVRALVSSFAASLCLMTPCSELWLCQ